MPTLDWRKCGEGAEALPFTCCERASTPSHSQSRSGFEPHVKRRMICNSSLYSWQLQYSCFSSTHHILP
jgi:hypothetical protein